MVAILAAFGKGLGVQVVQVAIPFVAGKFSVVAGQTGIRVPREFGLVSGPESGIKIKTVAASARLNVLVSGNAFMVADLAFHLLVLGMLAVVEYYAPAGIE